MWLLRAVSLRHLIKSQNSPSPILFALYSDTPHKKSKAAPLQERKMIDRFKLYAKGGDGGSGCSSFRRSRHDRRGKADGARGGIGGDVILECSSAVWDFSSLQHHVNAKRGGHGGSKNKIGSRGSDKVVRVPIGTVIHLVEGEVPSAVHYQTSTDLDPWEIPGSLDVDLSESDQLSSSRNTSVHKGVRTLDNAHGLSSSMTSISEKSVSMNLVTQLPNTKFLHQSSVSFDKLRAQNDNMHSCSEDDVSESEEVTSDYDMSGAESVSEEQIQYNVAELTEQGQRVIIARGGEGGLGNVSDAKVLKKPKHAKSLIHSDVSIDLEASDENQSSQTAGLPGSEVVLVLELKSIADVGLVGMPNAGKSTLLGAMSRAKPTVGDYAFTTLRPNLGNLNYDDFSITVADIPGLIKGAHENRGLGHAFLRHIERTKVLAYVVDLAAALDGKKGLHPWEQLKDLVTELEHHREGLSDRPSLVVANKIDEEGAEEVYEELKNRVQGVPIYPVCAVLEEGVAEVKTGIRMLVNGEESYRVSIDRIML